MWFYSRKFYCFDKNTRDFNQTLKNLDKAYQNFFREIRKGNKVKCNVCNWKYVDLDLSVREWGCPECGSHHNRDVNTAINIRNEGLKLLGLSV